MIAAAWLSAIVLVSASPVQPRITVHCAGKPDVVVHSAEAAVALQNACRIVPPNPRRGV